MVDNELERMKTEKWICKTLAFKAPVMFAIILLVVSAANATNFKAYYTRIDTGEPWELHSRTGEYADLVVEINENERVVFHRSSSYLPYLESQGKQLYFEEVIPRLGDGPKKRPDKNNLYSYVRLIESNQDSIVVHWRYFPKFKLGHHATPIEGNTHFHHVVHEYFVFYPNGKVNRTIREGAEHYDDWNNPGNMYSIELKIESGRMIEVSRTEPSLGDIVYQPLMDTPVKDYVGPKPARWWKFDEGISIRNSTNRDLVKEEITLDEIPIETVFTVYKPGVSGSSFGFDGYYNKVAYSADRMPELGDGFTIEAWVAPSSYSISRWTAIAHQSEWKPLIGDYSERNGDLDIKDAFEQDIQAIVNRRTAFEELTLLSKGKLEVVEKEFEEMDIEPYLYIPGQISEQIRKGFFLGINPFGQLCFLIHTDQGIIELKSETSLPLYEWSQVAGSIDGEMAYLFLNGEVVSKMKLPGSPTFTNYDFMIGKNDEYIKYVSTHAVRNFSNFGGDLGFEGLIDEVKLFDRAVDPLGIKEIYESLKPQNVTAQLEKKRLPGHTEIAESFGAVYIKLNYNELWDKLWREPDHPDIVVKFDNVPASVVFWRGARSPGWVTDENRWISDQSAELTDWHWEKSWEGARSCSEHMSDYQCKHSHVRIIENTPARVVIHWRYASIDVLGAHPNVCRNEDDWGFWTDEYLTIYPDGLGVRFVDYHGDEGYHLGGKEGGSPGFHDTQFFSEPGTKPEDNIYPNSLTIVSHKDEVSDFDWSENHPEGAYDAQIAWINLKSKVKVFEVFPEETILNIWAGDEKSRYSKYSAWNHYPVAQIPSDGRFTLAPDRLTHSSLAAADNLTENGFMCIYGFTEGEAEDLIPLARSWNHPPEIINTKGLRNPEYLKRSRAFQLVKDDDLIEFDVEASARNPVVNLSFEILEWKKGGLAKIWIDGEEITNSDRCRQGITYDSKGREKLQVFIEVESTQKVRLRIE